MAKELNVKLPEISSSLDGGDELLRVGKDLELIRTKMKKNDETNITILV
jgi:hypothetical protein